jgi:hypothetical protein
MTKKIHKTEEDIELEKGHHFVKKSLDSETEEDFDDSEAEESENTQLEEENYKPSETVKKRNQKHISEQLSEIYKNDDGSLPNMSSFEKRKKRGIIRAFFTFLFSLGFFAAVLYFGYFYFQSGEKFSKKDVIISLVAEEKITSGTEFRYRVRYRNDQNVPVSQAKIVLRYPDGFFFEKSSIPPTNDAKNEWDLGTIAAQDSGFIDIYGKLYGDVGAEKSLRAFLNYTPANFSSEFQAVAVLPFQIADTPVALSITAPSSITKGQITTLIFTVTPRYASSTVENLSLVIETGSGFTRKSAVPESDNFAASSWSIPSLKGEKSVSLTGSFAGADLGSNTTITAKIFGSFDSAGQKQNYLLAEKQYFISFENKQFETNFSINGSATEFDVAPGDLLVVSTLLKNNFDVPVQNVTARVVFDAPSFQEKSILNWAKIDDQNKNTIVGEQISPEMRRGIISWDGNQVPALKNIAPSTQVVIPFSIPLKSREDMNLSGFSGHKIQATLELQYEQGGQKQAFVSAPIILDIRSDLSIDTIKTAPKEGTDPNEFAFTWNLWNTFHPLSNVEVVASIYGPVSWASQSLFVSGGDFHFDEAEKKMTWKFADLPIATTPKSLSFAFTRAGYNPTQTQLISKIEVHAKDTVTGKDIVLLLSETPNTP